MSTVLKSVSFDAVGARALATFWAAVFGSTGRGYLATAAATG
jgi:hypothetical protein